MLHPHRPRPRQLQRLHIHRLQIRASRPHLWPPVDQLQGYPLRFPFNLFRTVQLYQHLLPLQQLLDPTAQHRPMLRRYRKVTAEIEQRALAHPLPAALGTHQSVGVVDLAAFGTARLGAPDEHGRRIAEGEGECNRILPSMALHYDIQNTNSMKSIP